MRPLQGGVANSGRIKGHPEIKACHLSFVICHLSFVICHLSFVICQLSFVSRHFFNVRANDQ